MLAHHRPAVNHDVMDALTWRINALPGQLHSATRVRVVAVCLSVEGRGPAQTSGAFTQAANIKRDRDYGACSSPFISFTG